MTRVLLPLLLLWAIPAFNALAQENPKTDILVGEVTKYTFDQSKIFPGTVRDYWVYVPKQYDPAKPACVYVNQDGVQYNAPDVFDELIAKKEMPVTIGVFVMHGRVKAPNAQTPSIASTAATNTTAWATTTPGSCSTNCCPKSRSRRPTTAGRSGSARAATTAASAAAAAARSVPSPRRGNGPMPSAASSAASARMSASAAATTIRR